MQLPSTFFGWVRFLLEQYGPLFLSGVGVTLIVAITGTLAGFLLGLLSAFLGIGGGPINLVALFYFFSMDTKAAAQNSLYIILFSQITSFLQTVLTGKVPAFPIMALVIMVFGGLMGGFCGRIINKKMDSKMVDKLFICLMVVIIGINCYNIYKFIG